MTTSTTTFFVIYSNSSRNGMAGIEWIEAAEDNGMGGEARAIVEKFNS